jgi:hypothetical protein
MKKSTYLPIALLLSSAIGGVSPQLAQAQSPIPAAGSWQMSLQFNPPNRGMPQSTVGAGSRGDGCFKTNELRSFQPPLVALLPREQLGLTVRDRPVLFWQVASFPVKTAEFLLQNDGGEDVYRTQLELPDGAGIISFQLPEDAPVLEVGRRYHWYLSIVCDPFNFSANPTVEGWIERVEADSTVAMALGQAKDLRELPAIYASAGIWHDALTHLADLRCIAPRNLKVNLDWRSLLRSVGLQASIEEPLLNYCPNKN